MSSKWPHPAILGYVEPVSKKYRKETIEDLSISRVGGPPTFPKTSPALDITTITCPTCSGVMRLLLQLFAPEGEDRPHACNRLVYVFACDNGKCAQQGWSTSFKVLRSQSTHFDARVETGWQPSEYALMEIVSESEPEDTSSTKTKSTKEGGEFEQVMVENDGSEKYVKVKGDNAFYKFNKRLGLAPEQVLRYVRNKAVFASSDAATMWIADKGKLPDKDIPVCEHCKSPRSLEFQIMPTLLSFLDLDDTKAETLDWGVLCVYTCNEACKLANEKFVEEKLFRQEYDMKTSIF